MASQICSLTTTAKQAPFNKTSNFKPLSNTMKKTPKQPQICFYQKSKEKTVTIGQKLPILGTETLILLFKTYNFKR